MTVEEIVALIKEKLEENSQPEDQQPEDLEVVEKFGACRICEELLDQICPGWRE